MIKKNRSCFFSVIVKKRLRLQLVGRGNFLVFFFKEPSAGQAQGADCPVTFCRDKAELIVLSVSCSWEYCTPWSRRKRLQPKRRIFLLAVLEILGGRMLISKQAVSSELMLNWKRALGFLRIFYVSLIAGLEENSLSPKNKHFERFLNS